MASHELSPQSFPQLELQRSAVRKTDSELQQVEYDIVLDNHSAGEAVVVLDKGQRQAEIDWLSIVPDERGRGYGKQAIADLVGQILRSYPWIHSVTSVTTSVPALKSTIATPIPEGWQRTFAITAPNADNAKRCTDDPSEALDYLYLGCSVRTTIEKQS